MGWLPTQSQSCQRVCRGKGIRCLPSQRLPASQTKSCPQVPSTKEGAGGQGGRKLKKWSVPQRGNLVLEKGRTHTGTHSEGYESERELRPFEGYTSSHQAMCQAARMQHGQGAQVIAHHRVIITCIVLVIGIPRLCSPVLYPNTVNFL